MPMVFEYANSKGKKYYLHKREKLFYFAGAKGPNACDFPDGFKIVENQKTGLPMLKRK